MYNYVIVNTLCVEKCSIYVRVLTSFCLTMDIQDACDVMFTQRCYDARFYLNVFLSTLFVRQINQHPIVSRLREYAPNTIIWHLTYI